MQFKFIQFFYVVPFYCIFYTHLKNPGDCLNLKSDPQLNKTIKKKTKKEDPQLNKLKKLGIFFLQQNHCHLLINYLA